MKTITYPKAPIHPEPALDGSYDVVEMLVYQSEILKFQQKEEAYWDYVEGLSDDEYDKFFKDLK